MNETRRQKIQRLTKTIERQNEIIERQAWELERLTQKHEGEMAHLKAQYQFTLAQSKQFFDIEVKRQQNCVPPPIQMIRTIL